MPKEATNKTKPHKLIFYLKYIKNITLTLPEYSLQLFLSKIIISGIQCDFIEFFIEIPETLLFRFKSKFLLAPASTALLVEAWRADTKISNLVCTTMKSSSSATDPQLYTVSTG